MCDPVVTQKKDRETGETGRALSVSAGRCLFKGHSNAGSPQVGESSDGFALRHTQTSPNFTHKSHSFALSVDWSIMCELGYSMENSLDADIRCVAQRATHSRRQQ
jgi:hypothetical protein